MTELPPELKWLTLFEEMQNFNKDLEDAKKFHIFTQMEQEFHDRELLKELQNDFR